MATAKEVPDWISPSKGRRTLPPRSVPAVRAKVAHTQNKGRRLEVFVTAPVQVQLGWGLGGRISASFSTSDVGLLRLCPAHNGLSLAKAGSKTKTGRLTISGAPLKKGLCAPVRDSEFTLSGSVLYVRLPKAWLELAEILGVDPDAAPVISTDVETA